MVGVKVRKGWRTTPVSATFGTSRLPSLPLSRRRVLFAAVPTRPRWLRMDIESTKRALCTQSGGGINLQPWTPGGICSGPYPLTSLQSAAGRTRCYTVRGLCISTLHVSLIIRVLPRAESATGCIFRQRGFRAGAIHVQGRYFRSIRRALRGSDEAGRGAAKRIG